MPPRYAYWTILIDNGPTAFRAANRDDLLPTFVQLQRTNPNVVMKWFARGRLWDSPEESRAEAQRPRVTEKRDREWRPGGLHKDPRARFDKRKKDHRPRRDNDVERGGPAGADTRPREGGAGGASPAGPQAPYRPGGQRPFRPGGAKPFRPGGAKPFRPGGAKPFHPGGAKPVRPGGARPFRPGGAKPFRPGGAKPFRPGGARPFSPGPPRDRRK